MGLFEAFADELNKIANAPPAAAAAAASGSGMVKKIIEWIKKNPGKSGFAGGWLGRGLLGGSKDE